MVALSGTSKGSSRSRTLRSFQLDLLYPDAISSSSSSSSTRPPAAGAAAAPTGQQQQQGSAAAVPVSPSKDAAAAGGVLSPALNSSTPGASPRCVGAADSPGGALCGDAAAAAAGGVGGTVSTSAMPALQLGPPAVRGSQQQQQQQQQRPSFSQLLAASLRSEGVAKAWFDGEAGYAHVRQSRVPLSLPKVRYTPDPFPFCPRPSASKICPPHCPPYLIVVTACFPLCSCNGV